MSNQMVAPRQRGPLPEDPEEIVAKCGKVHLDRFGNVACRAHSKRAPNKCCEKPPSPGHLVCVDHGARTGLAKAKASKRLALGEAVAELAALGYPVDVDPAEAMLAMVHEAAGNVAVLRSLVRQLGLVAGPEGIAGNTGSREKRNEAAPHVFVTMYDAERERLVKWAKACRDAGVDERRVQLAEADGQRLATALSVLAESLIALVPAKAAESLRGQLPVLYRKAIETTATEAA